MTADKRRARVSASATLSEALGAMDAAGLGIVLVIDAAGRLVGTVTDGDVRRAVLSGGTLDRTVDTVMTTKPVTVSTGTDMQEIRRLFLHAAVNHVPVLDADGQVIDLMTVSDMLSMPLSTPDITEREIQAVLAVLRTGDLSLGPKVVEFEDRVADYAQRKCAIAVNSGTSGLHLVVRALGLTDGDEVITTPFSFVASSNCVLYERAVPVFVDIEPDTYNIDPAQIEAAITPRTRAILAVDVFGQPARYDRLQEIAERRGLALISDSCESIGAEFKGRRASTYGVAGVFGFYPNKQVTTGEGGVIVTDDERLAELCRSMRNQGRGETGGWLMHERLGFNYRLSDLSCALGVEQLQRLDEMLERRDHTAQLYSSLFAEVEDVVVPFIDPATTRMSWFVYVLRLVDGYSRADRDAVLQFLRRHGIGVANYFAPIHLQPFYRELFGHAEGDFPITERISERTLALPFHSNMTDNDCEAVAELVKAAIASLR